MRSKQRPDTSWAAVPGIVLAVTAPVAFVALGVTRSSLDLVIVGVMIAPLSLLVVWNAVWTMTRTASEIALTEEELTARPFIGPATTIRWDEIEELEERGLWAFGFGPSGQVRIFVRGGRRVVLDRRLPQFEEIIGIVRERAGNVRTTGDRRSDAFALSNLWLALAAGGVLTAVGVGVVMLVEGKTTLGVICLVLAPIGVGELIYMRWRLAKRSG